mmetsp:Transcript_8766/g.17350  ORF Transcript_8766/g.17350 Transcript_8766/m.17350 type:complete len:133 (-) Transcript_8766:7-405(-)
MREDSHHWNEAHAFELRFSELQRWQCYLRGLKGVEPRLRCHSVRQHLLQTPTPCAGGGICSLLLQERQGGTRVALPICRELATAKDSAAVDNFGRVNDGTLKLVDTCLPAYCHWLYYLQVQAVEKELVLERT